VDIYIDQSKCGTINRADSVNVVSCDDRIGRYIKLKQIRQDYLTLCEVKVYGWKVLLPSWVKHKAPHAGAEIVRIKASAVGFAQPTGGTSLLSGVINTNQGSYYVDTKRIFKRPADVSVKIRQNGGSPECGVISIFPQSSKRHSGYNAGIGWWAHYFGAGVDGSISKYGGNNGATSSWHTVRINVAADGNVYFYLDGNLRHKVSNNKYMSGIIRLGYDCRNYQYKDLTVKTG